VGRTATKVVVTVTTSSVDCCGVRPAEFHIGAVLITSTFSAPSTVTAASAGSITSLSRNVMPGQSVDAFCPASLQFLSSHLTKPETTGY